MFIFWIFLLLSRFLSSNWCFSVLFSDGKMLKFPPDFYRLFLIKDEFSTIDDELYSCIPCKIFLGAFSSIYLDIRVNRSHLQDERNHDSYFGLFFDPILEFYDDFLSENEIDKKKYMESFNYIFPRYSIELMKKLKVPT